MSHTLLIKKLKGLEIPPYLIQLIESYLLNRKQIVVINGDKSNPADVTSGVPQGSLLGPLLFNLYVSDLPKIFKFCKCLMYADDLKLYQTIESQNDCNYFQADLQSLYSWVCEWEMSLSLPKCFVITFTNKFNKIYPKTDYNINGSVLQRVVEAKDLGIIFDSRLTFTIHTKKVKNKANKMLGFIRRNSKFLSAISLKTLYIALVRPITEYATPVWSPCHVTKDQTIESCQRKFVRMYNYKCRRNHVRENYVKYCKELSILTLQDRR